MNLGNILEKLKKILPPEHIKINEPMKDHTSFKIGGPADILILPEEVEEVKKTIELCKFHKIPFLVIGNGTNLLVRDEGIRGVVIKLSSNFNDINVKGNIITCRAGVALCTAARVALENRLSGLEFANGIPGSIGGAAVMNAGAYGGEMADVVINTVNIQNTEMSSILCTKDEGLVYFFSMATGFTKAALGAEGVGKDVTMIIGNGYTKGHAEIALQIMRESKELRKVFEKLYA